MFHVENSLNRTDSLLKINSFLKNPMAISIRERTHVRKEYSTSHKRFCCESQRKSTNNESISLPQLSQNARN